MAVYGFVPNGVNTRKFSAIIEVFTSSFIDLSFSLFSCVPAEFASVRV